MNNENNYIQGLFGGLKSLCTGLKTVSYTHLRAHET